MSNVASSVAVCFKRQQQQQQIHVIGAQMNINGNLAIWKRMQSIEI